MWVCVGGHKFTLRMDYGFTQSMRLHRAQYIVCYIITYFWSLLLLVTFACLIGAGQTINTLARTHTQIYIYIYIYIYVCVCICLYSNDAT